MMKTWLIGGGALVLVLALATGLWAQNAAKSDPAKGAKHAGRMQGGLPPMMGPGAAVMHADDSGLFTLERGTLTKYAAGSLEVAGTVDLKPARTETPSADTTTSPAFRPMRGVGGETFMLTKVADADTVLAVVGGTFYRINAGTLAIEAQGALPELPTPTPPAWAGKGMAGKKHAEDNAEQTPAATDSETPATPDTTMKPEGRCGKGGPGCGPGFRGRMGMMGRAFGGMQPTMELSGATLYIKRGPQIASVDITTGKVLAEKTAPLPTAPDQATTAPPAQ